jgi:hypothetical protein
LSASLRYGTGVWPTAERLARERGRARFLAAAALMGVAAGYGAVVVVAQGSPLLAVPIAGAFVGIMLFVWPRSGLYALLGAAVLFEEWGIAGLEPITAQTHFFQNVSGFTEVPLRLSMADMLALLTLGAWGLRRMVGVNEPARAGPVGGPVLAYGVLFALGLFVGMSRGGSWWEIAALAELRAPVFLCLTYFLTVNMIREPRHVAIVLRLLLGLIAVKALQGLANYLDMLNGSRWLEAVTAHEDVVFLDLVIILALAAALLRVRTRLALLAFSVAPIAMATELVTQRRVAFIALGAALVVLAVLLAAQHPQRTIATFGLAVAVFAGYAALFWDQQGLLAEPIRAIKGTIDPTALSARDLASNWWREIEDMNIAYTIRQLPLTGVGLGQQYLFLREPPELTNFVYWRYMTHDAVLWVWLKAGLAGFLAFWTLVGQTAIVGARLFRLLPSPQLKLLAVVPITLIVIQVVFSSVDLGLTYTRCMIVLGVALGLTAYLADQVRPSRVTAS